MTPAVSVIIPCRNEVRDIHRCLKSILGQVPVPGDFELIVADGMSEDGTRRILQEMASQDARLRVIDNPAKITPCGMNAGVLAARGQWIAIMGGHARYAEDYLVRCCEAAMLTKADNVGGAMFCEWDHPMQHAIAAAHHSLFSVGGARWHDPDYEGWADTVFGGFYRRDVFERIGMFDEELVRNQDDEFNLRLTRAGGRIWQSPRVKSWYRPRGSLRALFSQYKQYGYWKVRVIQKHRLPASWRHLVPGLFMLSILLLGLLALLSLVLAPWAPWGFVQARIFPGVLALGLGGYGFASGIASVATAARHGWSTLPLLPLAFLCYHAGYGYGFLRGTWDFVLCGKPPATQFTQLTRTNPKNQGELIKP